MFNDHILRTLSRSRIDDAVRGRRQRIEPRGGPALRAPRRRAAADAPVTIRHAGAADLAPLERLAALDSKRIPSGELFVAEVDGRPLAAVSLDTGAVIADPFESTAGIVALLRTHAGAVRPAAPRPPIGEAIEQPEEPTLPKAA